jgi:hypothetical protein
LGNRPSALLTKSVRRREPQTEERRSGQGSSPCERDSGRSCGPEGSCLCDVRTRHGGQINKKRCTTWSESWDAGVNGSSPKECFRQTRQWSLPFARAPCRSLSIRGLSGDALWRGMPRTARSSCPLNRIPNGCGTPGGAPRDSSSCHTIDTSNHRDAGSAGADFRTTRGPAARERLPGESFSGRLLTQVFEERLLLFAGQELVVA